MMKRKKDTHRKTGKQKWKWSDRVATTVRLGKNRAVMQLVFHWFYTTFYWFSFIFFNFTLTWLHFNFFNNYFRVKTTIYLGILSCLNFLRLDDDKLLNFIFLRLKLVSSSSIRRSFGVDGKWSSSKRWQTEDLFKLTI